MSNRVLLSLLAPCVVLLGACITHITEDKTQNPPPAERFANFNRFEMNRLVLAPGYAGQNPNERALAKIQQNVSLKMDPALAQWNASKAKESPARTLVIKPVVTEIKFINANARIWAGPLAGSSAVVLRAEITERESGKIIATPEFYARAAAMGGTWTFGITDNLMLVRVADRLSSYIEANYDKAVGGPTGAKPAKK